jgi:YggT family protein
MSGFLIPVIELIRYVLYLYQIILICSVVLSWLIGFRVVNTYSRAVTLVGDFLYRVTEPMLRPIRRLLPNMGGIDLSPLIALLLLWFIDRELLVLQIYLY